MQRQNNCIGHIRTMGAMCAIELVFDGDADKPDADLTKAIAAEGLNRGVLLLTCGVRGNVIRFLPPLTIGDELLDEALAVVAEVISALTDKVRKAS